MGWSAERIEIDKTVRAFAGKHRLRLRRHVCDDLYIPARLGQIFDHEDGAFGVMFLHEEATNTHSTMRIWNRARCKLLKAGCQIIRDCDEEGTALFDPENAKQAKLAFELVKPYRKRQMTEAAKQKFRENLERARQSVAFA